MEGVKNPFANFCVEKSKSNTHVFLSCNKNSALKINFIIFTYLAFRDIFFKSVTTIAKSS